jgi:hypothetical protein
MPIQLHEAIAEPVFDFSMLGREPIILVMRIGTRWREEDRDSDG